MSVWTTAGESSTSVSVDYSRREQNILFLWTTAGESSISVCVDYSKGELYFCPCGLKQERVVILILSLWTTAGESRILSLWTTVRGSSISVSVDYSRREQNVCLFGLQQGRVAFLSLWTSAGESSMSLRTTAVGSSITGSAVNLRTAAVLSG